MTGPTLSVVTPTFNRVDSVRVLVGGLRRQTYPPDSWELVIISDGSDDGTDAFLAEAAQTAPFPIRLLSQQNSGPAAARNRGIREADGDIVVFIDDDVEPLPDLLARHAAHHRADPRVAVIGPLSRDPARRAAEPVWIAWEHAMLEKQYDAFRSGAWATPGPHHFYSGNSSVQREHLLAVDGFDETFTRQEDVEMAARLERERSVRFVVDLSASGIHRPIRNFASWLKVPYAYGKLDVVRARRGDIGWERVRHGYAARNRATRLLARAVLFSPGRGGTASSILLRAATAAYRLRRDSAAFAALSALYNVRYLEGVRDELGDADALRRVLY